MPRITYVMPVARVPFAKPEEISSSSRKKQGETSCQELRSLSQAVTILIADLPPERLKLFSPPFSMTGVDLFDPFFLYYGQKKENKSWGALFARATVRAIPLEIVDDLSSKAFLHALR